MHFEREKMNGRHFDTPRLAAKLQPAASLWRHIRLVAPYGANRRRNPAAALMLAPNDLAADSDVFCVGFGGRAGMDGVR